MMRNATVLALTFACLNIALAKEVQPDACTMKSSCTPVCLVNSCVDRKDERDCRLGFKLFGLRSISEDVACVGARTAQNQIYADAKATCERSNVELQARCADSYRRCVAVLQTCNELYSSGQFKGRLIIWIDDNPDNNAYERQALEKLGAKVMLATTTSAALDILRQNKADLIISDFSRADDPAGGYTLLKEVKGDAYLKSIPYIIFSSGTTAAMRAEAIEKGATTQTSSAVELMKAAAAALKKKPIE